MAVKKKSKKISEVDKLHQRLEAMEVRLGMMNMRMESLGHEEAALHSVADMLGRLEGTMFVCFESVCNLDDLLRRAAPDGLREKRVQFFGKRG